MIIHLGQFEITSGKVVVSDPCYELRDTIIMGVLDNVLNGTWNAQVYKTEVRDWGETCSKLIASHSTFAERQDELSWIKGDFIVGVDSGQAGIFDVNHYRLPDPVVQEMEPNTTDSDWYYACCDITESEEEAGVLDGGVVSHTGLGDGAYAAYYAANDQNQIIGVKIIFIKDADL
ncbi:DUF4241 domain-containing protein [Paenibacillus sp.]|uniref:DUF4241 domain-containing protein n=1 Tax=Paenibacillus sp. TaxID=58172 RepID=UPI0028201DCC|nr:DUF4241 domain-containing protein [Paenibacillus sp.]MDR0268860.1 DUF4241 domain-containing protein [Paenibacillus sp.]